MAFTWSLVLGLMLPALATVAVLLVFPRSNRFRRPPGVAGIGPAVALATGYACGHAVVRGWPTWPPGEASQWVPYLALAALTVGLLDAGWPAPSWTRWGNRLLLAGLTVGLTLRPLLARSWHAHASAALGLGIAAPLVWGGLDAIARHSRGAVFPFALALAASGLAVTLGLSGSVVLARLAGALASALFALAVVASLGRELALAHGTIPLVVVILLGLGLNGYFYNAMPAPSGCLLGIAPLATIAGQAGPIRRLGRSARAATCLLAVLVPVALAVSMAAMAND